jgi:hypothetical protein
LLPFRPPSTRPYLEDDAQVAAVDEVIQHANDVVLITVVARE